MMPNKKWVLGGGEVGARWGRGAEALENNKYHLLGTQLINYQDEYIINISKL